MSRRGITSSLRFISHARSSVFPRVALPATSIAACRATSTRPFSSSRSHFENMRCVLIKDGKGPVENLYLGEEATPSPQKGEVLVKVGRLYE